MRAASHRAARSAIAFQPRTMLAIPTVMDRCRARPSSRQHAGRLRFGWPGLLLVALLLQAPPARAAKTDVVVISNGDHFTGEVKSLDRGRLKLNTDNAGDIYIEWDKIRRVVSSAQFDIETVSGHHELGSLRSTEQDVKLHVIGAQDSAALDFGSVVRITPLKTTFWGKIDGSVDVGTSFALANHLSQFNTAASATYRERKYSLGMATNSTLIHQDNVPDTRRGSLGLTYARFFDNRWQAQGAVRFERNDQLGLDLRASADGGVGRFLLQSNSALLDVGAGLSGNRERRADGSSTFNLEAIVTTDYSSFVYDSPKVNVDAYLRLYPSLSTWGRLRLEASAVAKREVVKDLFVGLNGVESYDNQPPEGVTNTDWNLYLSLGWTF
jgi:hypothetical protein